LYVGWMFLVELVTTKNICEMLWTHLFCITIFSFFLFFLVELGVWTQGFVLTKQALYHLSHTSSPAAQLYRQHFLFFQIHPQRILQRYLSTHTKCHICKVPVIVS
jgi:hypothetical protein